MKPFQFYSDAIGYAFNKALGPISMLVETTYCNGNPLIAHYTVDYYWDYVNDTELGWCWYEVAN